MKVSNPVYRNNKNPFQTGVNLIVSRLNGVDQHEVPLHVMDINCGRVVGCVLNDQ